MEGYEKLLEEKSENPEDSAGTDGAGAASLDLESVFGTLPCGIASFDLASGTLDTCNDMFARILGHSEPAVLAKAHPMIENLFVPEFRETCRAMMDKLRNKLMSTVEAFGVIPEMPDGSEPHCTLMLKSTVEGGREVVLALLSDFSGEYAESASYNDLKAIIGNMPGGMIKFNADDYRIDFVSDAFRELTGYTGEEALLKYDGRFDKMIFREDREYTLASMAEQLNMYNEAVCDHRIDVSGGGMQWFTTTIRLTRDGAGNRWCYAILNKKSDIPERRISGYNTHIDHLTHLLDKSAFEAAATEKLKENGENNVLITLDLDNFSLVNENYGHKHCDELLRVVADFLCKEFRERDVIARIGSDEFAVLVTNASQPESVFERMNGICKRMIAQIGVSCSMGVAISSAECHDYETLFSRAMRAMREVKKSRKNGCALFGAESDRASV